MAKLEKKYLELGTGAKELNSRDIPANYTPTNYTPSEVASEGTDKISAHLKGINDALSSSGGLPTDIPATSFTTLANNTTNQTITGFLLDSTVRSFNAEISILIDNGGTGLYTSITMKGVRKHASQWSSYEISTDSLGDIDFITDWTIQNVSGDGQVRVSIGNISGFVSGSIQFRVITLSL